jgi:serine-type D-Ala-D-Ala carboxypeptidase/endopeptidase (penicillin-binding protein 4)
LEADHITQITKKRNIFMNSFTLKKAFWQSFIFAICLVSTGFVATAQPAATRPPLMQNIRVQPEATPTPLITRTGSSAPTTNSSSAAISRKTSIPALAEVDIPGYSGILIENEKGSVVLESYSNYTFNPASNVKVATAYAVLKTFGVNYRFATSVWTDGGIDAQSGTLTGNVYISGRDPVFAYEHAIAIADELNRMGIRKIEGDLIVTDNFSMNYSAASRTSASLLQRTLNGAGRTAAATRAWDTYLANSGTYRALNIIPSVVVTGNASVEGLPSNVRLLFAHESAPLREIVKATLSYSNNFLSERLGDMLGGAYAVARTVQQDARVPAMEFSLDTCSGLGINRVSPRAQMQLLRVFKNFLAKNKMTFADVMPVAGIDDGTLRNRFNTGLFRGSVVGKTGTLGRTDGGVSTLSGEITTKQGKFLFVIFNQRGSVTRFRSFQNFFVPLVQGELGGAAPMRYVPVPMEKRLAKSRIRNPKRIAGTEEDEE